MGEHDHVAGLARWGPDCGQRRVPCRAPGREIHLDALRDPRGDAHGGEVLPMERRIELAEGLHFLAGLQVPDDHRLDRIRQCQPRLACPLLHHDGRADHDRREERVLLWPLPRRRRHPAHFLVSQRQGRQRKVGLAGAHLAHIPEFGNALPAGLRPNTAQPPDGARLRLGDQPLGADGTALQ